ncbi:hypothetical protein CI109_101506 [Kwoniella shandongensis]|uniref:Uncharacterized protein n=1 Tax=Kwoniella shandongensis TaxID=1734106 RepID=A0A5M6C2X3_9TREE|nr:uncharacterized protein CI109_001901 [Kwoniella shandongensis]KAA5529476.1 hypothetical protein CI109_001901 [Kwoniella shandongensis]
MTALNDVFVDPGLQDVLVNILSHLQGQDLVFLRRVSKHFRQLIDTSARLRVILLQYQLVAPPSSRSFTTAAEEREEILETERRLVAFRPKEIRCFHRPNSQFLQVNGGYLILAEGGEKTESTGWSVWKLPEPELEEERKDKKNEEVHLGKRSRPHSNGNGNSSDDGDTAIPGNLTGWRIDHKLQGCERYLEVCVPDNLMAVLQIDSVPASKNSSKSRECERIHFFQLRPDETSSDQSSHRTSAVQHPAARWPYIDIPFLSPKKELDNVRYKVYPSGKVVINIRRPEDNKIFVMLVDWKTGCFLGGLSYVHDEPEKPAFGFGLLASDVLMLIRRRKLVPKEHPPEFFMSHQCSLDTYAFPSRISLASERKPVDADTLLSLPDGTVLTTKLLENTPFMPLCSHLLPNPRRIFDADSHPLQDGEPLVDVWTGFLTTTTHLTPIAESSRNIFVVQIHGTMKPSHGRGEYRPSFYWYLEYSRFRRDILALARQLSIIPEKAKTFEWSEWTSSAQISAEQLPDTPSIIGARAFSWWPCGQGNLFRPWGDHETVHEFSTRDFAPSNRLPPSDPAELESLSTSVVPCEIAPECPSAPPELLELEGSKRVEGVKVEGKGRQTDLLPMEGFDIDGHDHEHEDGGSTTNGGRANGHKSAPPVHEQVLNELSLHRDFHQVLLTRPDDDIGDAMAQKQFNPECDGRWIVLHFHGKPDGNYHILTF